MQKLFYATGALFFVVLSLSIGFFFFLYLPSREVTKWQLLQQEADFKAEQRGNLKGCLERVDRVYRDRVSSTEGFTEEELVTLLEWSDTEEAECRSRYGD